MARSYGRKLRRRDTERGKKLSTKELRRRVLLGIKKEDMQ